MDYPVLWFALWGVLWTAYFITGGFDLGAGMLLSHLGKTESGKESLLESFGPLWNGNEVWLITAAGATFAAFPAAYALMFSSFYIPFLLILFALIVRGVALEFREKLPSSTFWLKACDAAIIAGSATTAFLLGIVFGNLFQGLPMDQQGFNGPLSRLINGYTLLAGVLFLLLFLEHGALWIAFRTKGDPALQAAAFARRCLVPLITAIGLFLFYSAYRTDLFMNYLKAPILFVLPVFSIFSLIAVWVFLKKSRFLKAFLVSGLNVILIMAAALAGLFPNLLPSQTHPEFSITAFNAASNPYTLKILTVIAVIFIPLIVLYQSLVYRAFREGIPKEGPGGNLYL